MKDVESLGSIFIGGGTPSTLELSYYEQIFKELKRFDKNIEITIEANPTATYEWLNGIKKYVNRISFGVQSFDETKLKFLGRNHSGNMAEKAVKNASNVGFINISLDLIYDTKLDTKELIESDLSKAFSLPINHISCYSLTLEEKTKFFKQTSYKVDNYELTKFLFDKIKKHGFKQYEISNFGSYESSHNKGYWEYKEYIGVGSGAVGFRDNTRYYNHKNLEKYIASPLEYELENLDTHSILIEKIFLGLRSIIGLSKDILDIQQLKRVQILLEENKIKEVNGIVFNNDFLLADELALFITQS